MKLKEKIQPYLDAWQNRFAPISDEQIKKAQKDFRDYNAKANAQWYKEHANDSIRTGDMEPNFRPGDDRIGSGAARDSEGKLPEDNMPTPKIPIKGIGREHSKFAPMVAPATFAKPLKAIQTPIRTGDMDKPSGGESKNHGAESGIGLHF